jgi:aspartate aminotransferase-like enzyme
LRSYPGLSMVFYNHVATPSSERLPRYLDLGYYAAQSGVPFTFSSNLLHALHAAVKHVEWTKRFAGIAALGGELRQRLRDAGFTLLAEDAITSPAVATIVLPPELNSVAVGNRMQEAGFLLSFNSGYLRERNWLQVCMLGECAPDKLVSLVKVMSRVCFQHQPLAVPAARV